MDPQETITINGQEFSFTPGETILEIATRNEIYIPTLCYLKGASPTGACRICLVEVEGAKSLMASCATPAAPKMVVRTETPDVVNARRMNLELLLASGHHNCLVQDMDSDSWTDFQLDTMSAKGHQDLCPVYGECRLQDLAIRYRVNPGRFAPVESKYPVEDVNPFIVRDFSRCILCGRCVRVCEEVITVNSLDFINKGKETHIGTAMDRDFNFSRFR